MFSSINKTFGRCSKIFGSSDKKSFVVPNFVAVTKPFFPCSDFGGRNKKLSREYKSLTVDFLPAYNNVSSIGGPLWWG